MSLINEKKLGSLRYSIFNKKQETTMVLVHGLFTHEGYWLPYLTLLRDFRLILVGIPYDSDDFDPHLVRAMLAELISKHSAEILVGHSLGSIVVRLVESDIKKVLICDIAKEERVATMSLNELIPNFDKITEAQMKNSLANAKHLLNTVVDCNADIIYTPSKDELFIYSADSNFDGTHFEIREAIIDLAARLKKNVNFV